MGGKIGFTAKFGRVGAGALLMCCATIALGALTSSCQNPMQKVDPNAPPEMSSPDWKDLRALVAEYGAVGAEPELKGITAVQSRFRDIAGRHGKDRIGDEALYYVGRIYYDIRAYHDARVTFMRHRELFQNSEFAPTIAKLEEEMARSDADYKQWLDQSRTTTTVTK